MSWIYLIALRINFQKLSRYQMMLGAFNNIRVAKNHRQQ